MTAKQMFEEIGYNLDSKTKKCIRYSWEGSRYIVFYLDVEHFKCYIMFEDMYRPVEVFLDEFKAITKQIEELGWII